jgi:lysophospholipase L1-like esterase
MTVGMIGATVSNAPRNVANRAMFPLGTAVATSTTVCLEGRTRHTFGCDTPYIQVAHTGIYFDSNNVPQNCGNDQGIEHSIEIPSVQSSPVRMLWGGGNTGTITNGVVEYLSDQLFASSFGLPYFPGGTQFWLRSRKTVTNGQNYIYGQGGNASLGYSGEGEFFSDGTASQITNSGAMTTPSGGSAAANNSILPTAFIGAPTRSLSIMGVGDSLMYGGNDNWSDGTNGMGWFPRGLHLVNGRQCANANFGRGGSTALNFVTNISQRSYYYKYHDVLVIHYGTNDLATGRTAAQAAASILTIAQNAKANGIRWVVVSAVFPRTDSSNVPISGFATGGARDVLNASLAAMVGNGYVDQYIDLSSAIADPVNTDRWNTGIGVVSDWIHPNATGHVGLGNLFNPVAAGWRLY